MRKLQFAIDSIYHIYNRGVEKRKIFLDKEDHFRFMHNLFEFNDEEPADNIYYRQQALRSYTVEAHKVTERNPLVEIIAYCLMPNHFHLLVRQHHEQGITRFMQKLGTGYSMYFNQKYQRVGGLFQGRFKAVLIEREPHFLYLPHYIHLNPLDMEIPSWRNSQIRDVSRALHFLELYRWSSYLDYIGENNFPSIISGNGRKFYGEPNEYKQSLRAWLDGMNIEKIREVALEDVS